MSRGCGRGRPWPTAPRGCRTRTPCPCLQDKDDLGKAFSTTVAKLSALRRIISSMIYKINSICTVSIFLSPQVEIIHNNSSIMIL